MRAKTGYAEMLYLLGRKEESLQEYAELLELNPSDNQGLRYAYATQLLVGEFGIV